MVLHWNPRVRQVICLVVPVLFLGFAFGPSLLEHVHLAMAPNAINGDACQHVAPYLQYSHPEIFAGDYVSSYFESCHPVGYRILMRIGARLTEPRQFGIALSYFMLFWLVVAGGWAAYRLGGKTAGWFTAAFLLSSPFFLHNMTSGLPRGFRSPFLALLAAAMATGNPYAIGSVLMAATAFDPAVTLVGGMAFAWVLLATPSRWRGKTASWSFLRRLAFLAVTGSLIVLVHLPVAISTRSFGSQLGKKDWAAYPEAGPGGRTEIHAQKDLLAILPQHVREGIGAGLFNTKAAYFRIAGQWISRWILRTSALWWMAAILLLLSFWKGKDRAAIWRLAGILPASLVAYLAARRLYPLLFEPDRHLVYPLACISAILLVTAARAIGLGLEQWLKRHSTPKAASRAGMSVSGAILIALFLAMGGTIPRTNGLTRLTPESMEWISFASTLPENSLIAGYPQALNAVPLLAHRRVLLNYETLLPYHRNYVDRTRERMQDTIAATYATNTAPLLALREKYGVTHLVLSRRQYDDPPPAIHPPYQAWIAGAFRSGKNASWEAVEQRQKALVFENKTLSVLDLRRITSETP